MLHAACVSIFPSVTVNLELFTNCARYRETHSPRGLVSDTAGLCCAIFGPCLDVEPLPRCSSFVLTPVCSGAAAFPLLQARPAAGNVSHHIEDNPSSSSRREPSQTRGRALTASSRNITPRSQTPALKIVSGSSSPDRTLHTLERKPSGSYAHNRNTSIVHGIQHSRNTSFVNSPATSPLSPQVIAAAGAALDGAVMSQELIAEAFVANGMLPGASNGSGYNSAGAQSAPSDGSGPHRKPERAPSARSLRSKGHNHHRSQSRHPQHSHELKTVGEYALHHLFNSFISQAEQKINQCMTDRGQPEARVEAVCGPGVDPTFDQLIAALGHIARHKPKPLIDTIMLWRKAKSEEASKQRTQLLNVGTECLLG
jgi:hypothetical protein